MKEVQGGRGDSNRPNGKEPAKKRPKASPAISLNSDEQALAKILERLACGNLQRVIDHLSYGGAVTEDEKKGKQRVEECRAKAEFSMLPDKGQVVCRQTYAPQEESELFSGLGYIAEFKGIADESVRNQFIYTITPRILLEYLNSEPVVELLEKIRLYDKSLPVDERGGENHSKLAELTSHRRVMLAVLKDNLESLQKELLLAKHQGNKQHPGITSHSEDGLGLA